MVPTRYDGRARLQSLMASYPDLTPQAEALLAQLPWRARRAALMVYGQGKTQVAAARELGVSRYTVARDLSLAVKLVPQMPQMQHNEGDILEQEPDIM